MNQSTVHKLEQNSIQQRVIDWVMAGAGDFAETDIYRALDLIDAGQKQMCSQTLVKLKEQCEIESVGTRYGWYRRIDRSVVKIDWRSASTKEFPIQLPFKIHEQARIFPKSIIVVSGEKNTGKTGFCLNVVAMNQNRYIEILDSIAPIYYYSSEMLAPEFKERLSCFRDVPFKDWNFEPIHRTQNFEDVVEPDGINIIDFLEIHDKFWLIGEHMTKIWQRLNNGIAIVCVQKADGKEHGRGADFLNEKPRLTMSLSKRFLSDGQLNGATLKVTNCKFPRMPSNPNGKSLDYNCFDGAELTAIGGWYFQSKK